MQLRIAYLGPAIDHRTNLELAMRKAGLDLVLLKDSVSWERDQAFTGGHSSKLLQRLNRVCAQFWGTRNKAYLREVIDTIDREGVTRIVAYWGTRPLADIVAIKRLRPQVRIALTVLCHPLGLTSLSVRLQHRVMGNAMKSLDGLILSSCVMERYFAERVAGSMAKATLVSSPAWCMEFAPKLPFAQPLDTPSVLFMGRMDWKSGQATDNVTAPLQSLMEEGVDLHFSRSPESRIQHKHAIPFDPLPLESFADFASQFDVSLVLYDLSKAPVKDRFEVTIPDRLITSVSAGVPIAIEKGRYAASREYLEKYEGVLEYSSMADLGQKLKDRGLIQQLREKARAGSEHYRLEARLPEMIEFLRSL